MIPGPAGRPTDGHFNFTLFLEPWLRMQLDVEPRSSHDDACLNRHTALHDRFSEVAKIGDASRLAYLNGPETVLTQEQVAAKWDHAVRNPISTMAPLNCVSVHVPFCKSLCRFL